jgi:hypothetical protein
MINHPGIYGTDGAVRHLTKINEIKQEICAVTGRVVDHLMWRDKKLNHISGTWDPMVKFNRSTLVDTKPPGTHTFPSTRRSPIKLKESNERTNRQKANQSEPTKNQKWP